MSKQDSTGQPPHRLRTLLRSFAPRRDGAALPPEQAAVLGRLADELNQALCAITANADAIARLVDQKPPDLDEVGAAAADIAADAQRASRAIRVAQRIAGVSTAVDIDVAQLVDQCVNQLRGEMASRRVSCEIESAAPLPGIRGFREELLQLLTRLVRLALEGMPGSQAGRRLRVRATRHDARAVAICIEEAGQGIGAEAAPRFFDSVCDRIVRAHGGHISVTQASGGGAALRLVLPASS